MNSDGITIRDATTADADVIADFNCRLAEESEDKALDFGTVRRGIRFGMTAPELCRYFIAEIDGLPVGTTMLTYELTDWRCGVIWWLQSVYVEPKSRKRGVFRALFEHIERLARENADVRGLRLYVKKDNHRAMRTYEAMGMSAAGYEVFEREWPDDPSPDFP